MLFQQKKNHSLVEQIIKQIEAIKTGEQQYFSSLSGEYDTLHIELNDLLMTLMDKNNRLEQKIQAICSMSNIGYYEAKLYNEEIYNVNTEFTWNQTMRDLTGLQSELELPDDIMSSITHIHPEDVDRVKKDFETFSRDKNSINEFVIEERFKVKGNNAYRWFKVCSKAFYDENNKMDELMGIFIDIDDQKNMNMSYQSLQIKSINYRNYE